MKKNQSISIKYKRSPLGKRIVKQPANLADAEARIFSSRTSRGSPYSKPQPTKTTKEWSPFGATKVSTPSGSSGTAVAVSSLGCNYRILGRNQFNNFADAPHMVGDPSFHRWRDVPMKNQTESLPADGSCQFPILSDKVDDSSTRSLDLHSGRRGFPKLRLDGVLRLGEMLRQNLDIPSFPPFTFVLDV
jgi:hypothetical protein